MLLINPSFKPCNNRRKFMIQRQKDDKRRGVKFSKGLFYLESTTHNIVSKCSPYYKGQWWMKDVCQFHGS